VGRDRSPDPAERPQRLFVAVEVPDRVSRAIEAATSSVRSAMPRARWVPVENRHVTLAFLGWTAPELVDRIGERIGSVAAAHGPVPTRLRGFGSFPSATRTRVLWVGLEDPDGRLSAIASAFAEALAPRVASAERSFTPHLTLARSDPPVRLEPAILSTPIEAPAFTIDRVVLFRSHLGPAAPRYEGLVTAALSGPADPEGSG
jgi:RNA 2',3'-cyclic 3'-phosphodiesterase